MSGFYDYTHSEARRGDLLLQAQTDRIAARVAMNRRKKNYLSLLIDEGRAVMIHTIRFLRLLYSGIFPSSNYQKRNMLERGRYELRNRVG